MGISRKGEKGVGLIGSVIAVAILLLVVFAVASLFRHGSILTVRTKTALRATHMIEEKMEELRGRGGEWFVTNDNWPIGTPVIDPDMRTVPINNPATTTILIDYWNHQTNTRAPNNPDSRDYLRIEVSIDWREDNVVNRERQAVTYLKF